MSNGERSRRRILEAAAEEFAERGIAGARVDRIAASSGVNKSQMYSYFGSKDGLFDRARGRIVGSEQYLTKPFTKDELLSAVSNQVG